MNSAGKCKLLTVKVNFKSNMNAARDICCSKKKKILLFTLNKDIIYFHICRSHIVWICFNISKDYQNMHCKLPICISRPHFKFAAYLKYVEHTLCNIQKESRLFKGR